jgi:predicted SnoaL-like aldol condensation-catalyzing enzyme
LRSHIVAAIEYQLTSNGLTEVTESSAAGCRSCLAADLICCDLCRIEEGKIAEHWDPMLKSDAKIDPNTKKL